MDKKYLYTIIGILILIILSLLTYERSETYVLKKNNGTHIYNFGIVEKEKNVLIKMNIQYTNKEFDSLKLYGIKDGCDCTKSSVEPNWYKKNDIISINTNYNPNKYNDKGIIRKHIFLVTNKKENKMDSIIPIEITGIIK